MNKILLCTDGSVYAQVSYQYAAWLAQKIDCEIEVLYVTDLRSQKAVQSPDFTGSIGIDSYQQLLSQLVELEAARAKVNQERANLILQEAETFFRDRQISKIQLTHETGFLVDLFHQLEKHSDLIILGKRGETASFASEHLGANMERIVRSSKKPCLVTPREFRPIQRTMLAYDGGKSCRKAIDYLIDSQIFLGLELHIVCVATKDEAKASNYLAEAEAKIQTAGFNPICQLLSGDPESVMEQYIEEHSIDLLLMGAYGHSRIRHLVIGSTTAQMLRQSHIPVFLFR